MNRLLRRRLAFGEAVPHARGAEPQMVLAAARAGNLTSSLRSRSRKRGKTASDFPLAADPAPDRRPAPSKNGV